MIESIIVIKREDLRDPWVETKKSSTVIVPPILETTINPNRRAYRGLKSLRKAVEPYFNAHPEVGELEVMVDNSFLFSVAPSV